jgi:hypothetical protein
MLALSSDLSSVLFGVVAAEHERRIQKIILNILIRTERASGKRPILITPGNFPWLVPIVSC